MNFIKKHKDAIALVIIGVFIIFFNYLTIDYLPYLGKIPSIFGILIIGAGLIKLEFGSNGKK